MRQRHACFSAHIQASAQRPAARMWRGLAVAPTIDTSTIDTGSIAIAFVYGAVLLKLDKNLTEARAIIPAAHRISPGAQTAAITMTETL
jgi:hypothetical protein